MCKDLILISVLLLDIISATYGADSIYVSNGTHIVSYTRQGQDIEAVLGQSDYRIIGLAVDIGRQYLFWSDISTDYKGVYRSDLHGNNAVKIIDDVGEINGVTVDWVSAHIYWTDVERKTVEVADYKGRARRILVNKDLMSPQSIVVAPLFGYLFWVDARNQRIERSWLDGSNRRTVVTFNKDFYPNQLAISNKRKMLFWVDAQKHGVYSCKLNGKGMRRQVSFDKLSNGAPGYGLVVFGNTALISTWFNTAMYVMKLESQQFIWQQLASGLGTRELFYIVSLNPDTQPMTLHPCMEKENGGCSHLCLPTHKSNYVCACPSFGELSMSPDNKTCTVPEEILLLTMEDTGAVGFVSLEQGHNTGAMTLVGTSTHPKAVTFDRKQKMVFWSDVTDLAIYRSRLDGSEKSTYLEKTQGIFKVISLHFHQGNGYLYFLNVAQTGYATLEYYDTHSGVRATLIREIKKPVDFLIDEEQRYIYVLSSGDNDNPSVLRTELDGSNGMTVAGGVVDPAAFVVTGDLLMVAERFNQDTVLTEIDMSKVTTVSTQLSGKSIDLMVSKGHDLELFLVDSANGKLMYMNHSKPAILLENGKIADMMYTRTTSDDITDELSLCSEHQCMCVGLPEFSHEGTSRCLCNAAMFEVLGKAGISCEKPHNYLLFTDQNTINLASLDEDTIETPQVVLYGDSDSVFTSLILNQHMSQVYWIDTTTNSIYVSHMHQMEPKLVYKEVAAIDNLVLDAPRSRLYWTGEDGGVSFIASLNMDKGRSSYKQILQTEKALLSLTLHPGGRWLYFGEKGSYGSHVCTCKTNGHRYRKLFDSGLGDPTSLVAMEDRLFVGDHNGGIYVFHIHDKRFGDSYDSSSKISGLAVHENLVVYSDMDSRTIKLLDLTTGAESGAVVKDLGAPGSLLVVHPESREELCGHGHACMDICAPLIRGQVTCGCLNGRFLDADEKSCMDKPLSKTREPLTTPEAPTSTGVFDYYEKFDHDFYNSYDIGKSLDSLTKSPETTARTTTINMAGNDLIHVAKEKQTTSTTSTTPSTTTTTTTPSTTTTSTTPKPSSSTATQRTTTPITTTSTTIAEETTTVADEKETTAAIHPGEPKPTLSTRIYETYFGSTEESIHSYGLLSPHERPKPETNSEDMPYFEDCPENETIVLTLPETSRSVEAPIHPTGYSRAGARLPLHSNYELTNTGIILHWEGDDVTSHHYVKFTVTDSKMRTTECRLTIILQDIDPPVFTGCPSTLKISTDTTFTAVNWTEPEVADNVGIKRLVISHESGSLLEAGEYLVNYTAIDYAGNHAHCVFTVFVLHDKLCQIENVPHGGIVCDYSGSVPGNCRVVCETGYVVNPIRSFRRKFNCKHPDDADALKDAMTHQQACLKHAYPSVYQEQYSMLVHGPISRHKNEVQANLSVAIATHLERERLCTGDICKVGDVIMKCEEEVDYVIGNNVTCLDEEERMEFFVNFNITLTNNTVEEIIDVFNMSEKIHSGLQKLTSLLQWQLGEHRFMAVSDSLTTSKPMWSCPLGQIYENNVCILCPPGTFHNITANACQYCSMGDYQDAAGHVTCKVCGPGRTSPAGATTHEQCHTLPSMDEMTLFIIVTTCSFGVVFLCMAVTLYLQFQRQQKRNQQIANQKKTRYNMTPNLYVAPPPILKSKLDDNLSPGERTYSIDRKHPINIFANHDYEDVTKTPNGNPLYQSNDMYTMLHGGREYSPGEEVPTGTLSRDNTFSNPTYSPQFSLRRFDHRGSLQRSVHTPSPGPHRKMSQDSTFSSQSPRYVGGGSLRTPTSDTPLITQSPLLRMKLAAYNLNHED